MNRLNARIFTSLVLGLAAVGANAAGFLGESIDYPAPARASASTAVAAPMAFESVTEAVLISGTSSMTAGMRSRADVRAEGRQQVAPMIVGG